MDFTTPSVFDITVLEWFNGSGSPFFDDMALTLTAGLTWIPLYLSLAYIVIKNNETMIQIGLVVGAVAVCLLLTAGVDDLIVKPWVMRLRPINDPLMSQHLYIIPGLWDNTFSFFSAHAANTFGIATFFFLLIREWRMTTALILWSLLNCWTRLYLGMHYPTDILTGLLWGFISGEIAYIGYKFLYHRSENRSKFISAQYTSTGFLLADVSLVINVLLLIILYAIGHALIMQAWFMQ